VLEVAARIADTLIEVREGPCRAHDGTPLVTPGTVTIGVVTYTITRTQPVTSRLARPKIDRRPFGYLALSLVAQLAVWLAAVTLEPFERLPRPVHRIVHVAHVREPDPPVPVKPPPVKTPPVKTAIAATRGPTTSIPPRSKHHSTSEDELDRLYGNPAAQIAHLAKTFDEIDVKGKLAAADGPIVDPTDDSQGFGGAGNGRSMKFDDTTYKVERYAVPTFVRTHKGQLAPVPAIEWCDDDSCMTRGPLAIERVLAILETHQAEIAQCYRAHTMDLVGNVRVRFPVGPDGKVTGKLGTEAGPVGSGSGTVGRCIAKIAQGIRWPKADDETYVFVGLAFRPAAG
jgi:hypothetical protein